MGEIVALIDHELVGVLRCPRDHSALSQAESSLVERVNLAITSGQVRNLAGQGVTKPIDGGLVREAGDLMYLVVDGIPVMLPDEAIELSQLDEGA